MKITKVLIGVMLICLGINQNCLSQARDSFSNRRFQFPFAFLNREPDNGPWLCETRIEGKDGSILVGRQLSTGNEGLRFFLNTNDTITVPAAFIRNIKGPETIILYKSGKYNLRTGIFATGIMGFGAVSRGFGFQMNGYLGYRFKKVYAAGIGTGFSTQEAYAGGLYLWNEFLTVSAFGRYYINDKRTRMFAETSLGYGYAVEWEEPIQGGVLIQPALGWVISAKNDVRCVMHLSYSLQYASGSIREWDIFGRPITADYNIWYRRLMISLGLELY